jgi:hypothetical protein
MIIVVSLLSSLPKSSAFAWFSFEAKRQTTIQYDTVTVMYAVTLTGDVTRHTHVNHNTQHSIVRQLRPRGSLHAYAYPIDEPLIRLIAVAASSSCLLEDVNPLLFRIARSFWQRILCLRSLTVRSSLLLRACCHFRPRRHNHNSIDKPEFALQHCVI